MLLHYTPRIYYIYRIIHQMCASVRIITYAFTHTNTHTHRKNRRARFGDPANINWHAKLARVVHEYGSGAFSAVQTTRCERTHAPATSTRERTRARARIVQLSSCLGVACARASACINSFCTSRERVLHANSDAADICDSRARASCK